MQCQPFCSTARLRLAERVRPLFFVFDRSHAESRSLAEHPVASGADRSRESSRREYYESVDELAIGTSATLSLRAVQQDVNEAYIVGSTPYTYPLR